jgi:hypothetical protein
VISTALEVDSLMSARSILAGAWPSSISTG